MRIPKGTPVAEAIPKGTPVTESGIPKGTPVEEDSGDKPAARPTRRTIRDRKIDPEQRSSQQRDMGRAALTAYNGAVMGFADELLALGAAPVAGTQIAIQDWLRSGTGINKKELERRGYKVDTAYIESAIDEKDAQDNSFKSLYTQARDSVRADMNEFREENFKTALALEVVGGLSTGGYGTFKNLKQLSDLKRAAVAGMAWGAAAGTGYSEGEDAEAVATDAAIGAAIGGTVAPALNRIIKVASTFSKKGQLKKLEKTVQDNIDGGLNPNAAYDKALAKHGFSKEDVGTMIDQTGRKLHLKANMQPKQSTDSSVLSTYNKTMQPISSGIADISPAVANRVRKLEMDTHYSANEFRKRVAPFAKWAESFNPAVKTPLNRASRRVYEKLDIALHNRDHDTVVALIKEHGDTQTLKDYNEMRKVMGESYQALRESGLDVGYLDDYFPRGNLRPGKENLIPDAMGYQAPTGLERMRSAAVQAKRDKAARAVDESTLPAKRKERALQKARTLELSKLEEAEIFNSYSLGLKHRGLMTPKVTRERVIDKVTPEIRKAYHSIGDRLFQYTDQVAKTVHERQFFGKHLSAEGFKINPKESVGGVVGALREAGEITLKDAHRITKLLEARFGYKDTSAAVQVWKNVFYNTKLAQFDSALTQLGDIGIGAYYNGILNTIVAANRRVLGKLEVTAEDLGALKVTQEFGDSFLTAKALNKTLKYSLFTSIDKLGKDLHVNGALRKNRNMVGRPKSLAKFKEKWGPWFQGETDQLVQDLQNKKLTDNVRLLLWNELSNVQPISLSEMPEAYLNSDGGRVLYTLKSFTIKQLDLLRRDALRKMASPKLKDKTEGITNLARYMMYFTGANMSVDQLKAWMLGRDVDLHDNFINNLWKNFGLSQYMAQKTSDAKGFETLGEYLLGGFTGPLETLDAVTNDMKLFVTGSLELEEMQSLKEIPIAGRVLYNLFGAGAKKYNDKQERAIYGNDDDYDYYN